LVTGVTTMRIGMSLCCANAGARPAANQNAAAPATKVLRVWLIVLSLSFLQNRRAAARFFATGLRTAYVSGTPIEPEPRKPKHRRDATMRGRRRSSQVSPFADEIAGGQRRL
jgi:hypothetical protein